MNFYNPLKIFSNLACINVLAHYKNAFPLCRNHKTPRSDSRGEKKTKVRPFLLNSSQKSSYILTNKNQILFCKLHFYKQHYTKISEFFISINSGFLIFSLVKTRRNRQFNAITKNKGQKQPFPYVLKNKCSQQNT